MSYSSQFNRDPRLERAPDGNDSLLHRTWKSFGQASDSTKNWLDNTRAGRWTTNAGILAGIGAATGVLVVGVLTSAMYISNSSTAHYSAPKGISAPMQVLVESHENYLIGVHTGMLTAGVEISDQTNARMKNFVRTVSIPGQYTEAGEAVFMEMRNLGAIAGAAGVTEAELVEYIDFVEGLSDNLARANARQTAAFDGMEGISSGYRLAAIAQVLAIAGDHCVEGGTTDELLDNITLTAFDEGYLPSKAEVDALRSKMTEAMAEVQQIAESEDIVAALQTGLLERNMTAFASDQVSLGEVIAKSPFDAEVTTNDPSCAPEY